MNEKEESRLSRFAKSRAGKVTLIAGAAGAVAVTVGGLLWLRQRNRTQANELKDISRGAARAKDATAGLVVGASELAQEVGSREVAETATFLSKAISDERASDALAAVAAIAREAATPPPGVEGDNVIFQAPPQPK